MQLHGSCHCGAVSFSLHSTEPIPFQRCYCPICRKTGGGGGYMINLGGDASTLEVTGAEHTRDYRALVEHKGETARSGHRRVFCGECGTHLWAQHDRWPDMVHPAASAIDTPLPRPPAHVHMMVGSKAAWVEVELGEGDASFETYPDQSLAQWHKEHGHWQR